MISWDQVSICLFLVIWFGCLVYSGGNEYIGGNCIVNRGKRKEEKTVRICVCVVMRLLV